MSLKINNVFDTEGPLTPSFEEFLQQERLTAMLKAGSTWLQLFLLISVIDGISNVTWKDLTHFDSSFMENDCSNDFSKLQLWE